MMEYSISHDPDNIVEIGGICRELYRKNPCIYGIDLKHNFN